MACRAAPVFVLATAGATSMLGWAAGAYATHDHPRGPPNVLVIVTDDHRAAETMDRLGRTRRWFETHGTVFPQAVATTPLCSPSRASILTGRYAHNHGVRTNHDSHLLDHATTLESQLGAAGYRTGVYGKVPGSVVEAREYGLSVGLTPPPTRARPSGRP
jgi:arylsulfatase A-like enzyme